MQTIKTRVHHYLFGVKENKLHAKQYKEMCSKLKGVDKVEIAQFDHSYFTKMNEEIITLDCSVLYPNRWLPLPDSKHITLDLDFNFIFDWLHCNRSLENKVYEGYYLEQTEEMQHIRDNTLKCIRCNTSYPMNHTQSFCLNCIAWPDLTHASMLYKTFLRPVSSHSIWINPKSIIIPHWLIDQWTERTEAKRVFDSLAVTT